MAKMMKAKLEKRMAAAFAALDPRNQALLCAYAECCVTVIISIPTVA